MLPMGFCWIKTASMFFSEAPTPSLRSPRLPQRGSNGYMATLGEVESPNKAQRKLSRGQRETPERKEKNNGNPFDRCSFGVGCSGKENHPPPKKHGCLGYTGDYTTQL